MASTDTDPPGRDAEGDTLDLLAHLLDLADSATSGDRRDAIGTLFDDLPWLAPLRDHLDEMRTIAGTKATSAPYQHALAAYRLAETILPELDDFLTKRIDDACRRQGITLGQVQRCLDAQQRAAMRAAVQRARAAALSVCTDSPPPRDPRAAPPSARSGRRQLTGDGAPTGGRPPPLSKESSLCP